MDIGLGAGLAALAFWGFVAVVVVAGYWNGIRKRDAQHETVRRLMESGQPIDEALMEKLSLVGDDGDRRADREFQITGLWMAPVAVGMALFGLILGAAHPEAQAPLLGVSALTGCFAIGWLIAAKIAGRWYADSESAD
jgi:hypothetical protein